MSLPDIAWSNVASSWVETLWRASWQGGVAIVLVWAVCRLFPAMPAKWRHWLWRIAVLKCALSLVLPAHLGFALINHSTSHSGEHLPAAGRGFANANALEAHQPDHSISSSAVNSIAQWEDAEESSFHLAEEPTALLDASTGSSQRTLDRFLSHFASMMALIWAVGLAVCLARLWIQAVRIHAIVRNSRSVTSQGLRSNFEAACARLNLGRWPVLQCSQSVRSPQLVGVLRPVVLVPECAIGHLTARDWELAFTHELTHFKRRDLCWNLLLIVTQTLFFFHPLVWLARREWSLTQEMAVDEATLSHSRSCPAEYGQMLLKLCDHFGISPVSSWSIGMAGTSKNLNHC